MLIKEYGQLSHLFSGIKEEMVSLTQEILSKSLDKLMDSETKIKILKTKNNKKTEKSSKTFKTSKNP